MLCIKKRMVFLFLIFFLCFIVLCLRLGYIQIISGSRITNLAYDLWSKDIPIDSVRGNIYDRKGKLLVGNKLSPSIAVIPKQVEDKEMTAYFLANILNVSRDSIMRHLEKNVSIELIKPEGRKISKDIADKVMEKKIKGVYVVGDSVRYYPYRNLLASVLGFTGIDNQGIAGVEYIYDSYLKGSQGALKIYTDAKGNLLNNTPGIYEGSISGMDIYLTIDLDVQLVVERVIEENVNRYNPEQMMVLINDVKTGEILAMGQYPTYDPENYQQYSQEIYNRNLPIWSSYEPGSTFKILTFASGLEEKVFKLDDPFFCAGYKMVEGARIKDWKAGGHGSETFLEVIQNSCNPGFMTIGERLGKEKFFDYVEAFGYGKKTGVDLLGEAKGIVFKKEDVGPVELACCSFGQGNSVTPIQLVMASSAAVNGGYLMTPYVLKAIENNIGDVIFENKPIPKRQVISSETSKTVAYALENVVAKGTGRGAYIDGYRIGGKTGTAQKVGEDGKYMDGNYILSFLGMAPMNDPKVCVYAAIDNPKNTIQYGGVVAAPIVKEIMGSILPILDVKKDYENQIEMEYRWYIDTKYFDVLDYVGMTKKEIKPTVNYRINYIGNGDKVISQIPNGGERVAEGSDIYLYMG